MRHIAIGQRFFFLAALLLISSPFPSVLAAQQQGPLPSPPASEDSQPAKPKQTASAPATAPTRSTACSTITHEPPALPVEQIIQKFGERELEFKKERDNFTYTQTFVIQTLDDDGRPDGEYRLTSDILFTPEGKRYEKVISAPPPTLERIQLTQQDMDDLVHVQPFVLTTYVYNVAPKKIEKKQRYFQGRIWFDDTDLQSVKSYGKAVPDVVTKKGVEGAFPLFETFRENIEGHYWFPIYTRSDDVLRFSSGSVRIHMTVRYANYKRFGATIKIGKPVEIQEDKKPDKP